MIVEGAYADVLLVDGNPPEDLATLTEWQNSIRLIIKNGEIFKNTLQGIGTVTLCV